MPLALGTLPSPSGQTEHADDGYESTSSNDSSDTIRVSASSLSSSGRGRARSSSPIHLGSFSDGDDDPVSPLLGPTRWWDSDSSRRRRRRDLAGFSWSRRVRRQWFRFTRHPLVPTQPITILFALVLFTLFAILLTLYLIYQLNPDKDALPWRSYCALQGAFPPENIQFDELTPAGVFLGIYSMDSGLERRMFVRTTFAGHNRSRVDDGTSRTIIRFILGKPRPDWERRIQLEAETYNDIIILPIAENMNSGKTHAYFTWAAEHAWVPAPVNALPFSYTNQTSRAPSLAPHDPAPLHGAPSHWVRPDFVVKADDDSFVMLAELEARLRVELHSDLLDLTQTYEESTTGTVEDPLIYWGYLIKNKFMGGELYSLSWDVVTWVAKANAIKSFTHGAEDKLVAQWMLLHPRTGDIRWVSESCWIYDHPKAGTVYSHGFLFPSEAARVRQAQTKTGAEQKTGAPRDSDVLSHSSVCSFGTRYQPPVNELTPLQSVEALVEGSALSRIGAIFDKTGPKLGGYPTDPATMLKRAVRHAWETREGRRTRYEGKKLGGTVVVHFIKRNEWWEETTLALLGGQDIVEGEIFFG